MAWEGEHIEYTMAHGLSHALINEVAIDCGYPASSVKERLYLIPGIPGQPKECGILIYTASAGNQGTLGGLVEVTRRFQAVMESALDRLGLCSGDPICVLTTTQLRRQRIELFAVRLATDAC